MHLSRVYCLLPGPPTTSNCPAVPISGVKHSGLLSMQSSISSPCVHCARDQRVWLTRGDLRTSPTGMPGNGSEQSLNPRLCLCRSDVWQVVLVMIIRGLGTQMTSSYITALPPGPHGHAIGDVSLSSLCSYLGQDIVMFWPSEDILITVTHSILGTLSCYD